MTSTLDTPKKLSKLEAINLILNYYGDSDVSSFNATPNASSAEKHLTLALVAVCNDGYLFSTTSMEKLEYDVDGYIAVADDVLKLVPAYYDEGRDLPVSGGRLYDRDNKTYTFTKEVYADVTRAMPFDDIPQAASWYVTITAAISFISFKKPADPVMGNLGVAQRAAKAALESLDAHVQSGTLVEHNRHFNRMRGRAHSRRRSE